MTAAQSSRLHLGLLGLLDGEVGGPGAFQDLVHVYGRAPAQVQRNRPVRHEVPGPVTVSGLSNIVAIAAGASHTCALRASGTVVCWGLNFSGQLGDNSTTNRLTPVAVSGLTNAVSIAAGGSHTCALRSDGGARCWGENESGQLGNNSTTDRTTPVTVATLANAVAIAAGGEHTCAVRVDGGVFCWGDNAAGEVGDLSTTDRRIPVEVFSFRANIEPDAELASNGHRVLLTALVNCPLDRQVTVEMTLTQGAVVGQGQTTDKCEGALAEYPLEVSVRQGAPFSLGPAAAAITAIVRDGHKVVDIQTWDRQVQIGPAP